MKIVGKCENYQLFYIEYIHVFLLTLKETLLCTFYFHTFWAHFEHESYVYYFCNIKYFTSSSAKWQELAYSISCLSSKFYTSQTWKSVKFIEQQNKKYFISTVWYDFVFLVFDILLLLLLKNIHVLVQRCFFKLIIIEGSVIKWTIFVLCYRKKIEINYKMLHHPTLN